MKEVLNSEEIISNLNDLIELDYDAIAAYESAIEKLEEQGLKNQLGDFLKDHQNHIANLSQYVRQAGGEPAEGPDMIKILTTGKVALAQLGGDHLILKAMRINEEVTNKTYEHEAAKNYPPDIQSTLDNNLADERRHRKWLDTATHAHS